MARVVTVEFTFTPAESLREFSYPRLGADCAITGLYRATAVIHRESPDAFQCAVEILISPIAYSYGKFNP